MTKAIEMSSLRADLSAVESLLANRTKQSDPIGWFQLNKRKDHLAGLLDQIKSKEDTRASVALYFGGRPVVGSRGIHATFAGKALEFYQDLIAKRLAKKERGEDLSDRGRVPSRTNSSLLITEVARGSFGFVLEEPEPTVELVNSALKEAVTEINDLVHLIGSRDTSGVEDEAEILDNRLLVSMRAFFSLLDDSGATMRVVTEQRQFSLSREQIEEARSKVDLMEWNERDRDVEGVLFVVPDSQRFDLESAGGSGATIRGKISKQCIDALREDGDSLLRQAIGRRVRASLVEKEVRSGRDEARLSYTLKAVHLIDDDSLE